MDMNEVLTGDPLSQQAERIAWAFEHRPSEVAVAVARGFKIIEVIERAVEMAREGKAPSAQTAGDSRTRIYRFMRSAFFVERMESWMPGFKAWDQAVHLMFQEFLDRDWMVYTLGRQMSCAKADLGTWESGRPLKDLTGFFFRDLSVLATRPR